MPRKPKKPCAYPGCPNLTEGRFCEEHKSYEPKPYEKKSSNPFYSTKEWKECGGRGALRYLRPS